MNFFQNTCKPNGIGGKIMVHMMNYGHSRLAEWGFSHLPQRNDLKILDAGCGGGANVGAWLEKSQGSCVTGLDYSEVSVAEARKRNAAEIQKGRCRIIQGNVADMPFEKEEFDCISAFETIYFWPDLKHCFSEVNRILRKNGIFMICNECDGTNAKDEKWTNMIDGMQIYTQKQITDFLKETGFTIEKLDSDKKTHWLCIVANKR